MKIAKNFYQFFKKNFNKYRIQSLIIIVFILLLLFSVFYNSGDLAKKVMAQSSGWKSMTNSLLVQNKHPRLHITPTSLDMIRSQIAGNATLKSAYQSYVNYYIADDLSKNNINDASHDVLVAPMVHQALIANIGEVSGVNLPISTNEYAQKAINAFTQQLNNGQTLGYVAALVYDWTYNFMTVQQRSSLATTMVTRNVTHSIAHTIANPIITPDKIFSSKYFEALLAYYPSLAIYGENSAAEGGVNSFYDIMLNNGYFDAQNFVGQGGSWSEWIGYASWHLRFLLLDIDAWRTATGEDYISNKNISVPTTQPLALLNDYASFLHYAIDPFRYVSESNSPESYSEFTFVRTGSAETTDSRVNHGEKRRELYFLPGILYNSGLTSAAGLVRDFLERYEVAMPTDYEQNKIWLFMSPFTQVTAISPTALNLPKSRWLKNIGTFVARTGFNNQADGVFMVNDSHYRFSGHGGPDDYPGFSLNKFGILVNTRNVAHRGYGNLDNYVDGFQYNVVDFYQSEKTKAVESQSEFEEMLSHNASYDLGGIEQVTILNNKAYIVRSDRTRAFSSGVEHTRDYVYLPGQNPTADSDFLVIYDRTQTLTSQQSAWVFHVPWKPSAHNYNFTTDLTTGSGTSDRIGTRFTGSDVIIEEHNGLGGEGDYAVYQGSGNWSTYDYTAGAGSHGVLFSKTLLPRSAQIEVTRVADFDGDVYKRQHHLAIKSARWQVAVKSATAATKQNFLNVMQVADENNESSMVTTEYIDAGSMEGAFFAAERSGRLNSLVLFNKEEVAQTNQFSYIISGSGLTRHVIAGLKSNTKYNIIDNHGNNLSVDTISDVSQWNYYGIDTVDSTGTLYFETTLSGSHTFTVFPEGVAAISCTDSDTDGYSITSDGSNTCGVNDCNDYNSSVNVLVSCSYNGSACGSFNLCVATCPTPPVEICGNGIDEDCNGSDLICSVIDTCVDSDHDGYTTSGQGTSCSVVVDCDDSNSSIHSGAEEICGDGIDNNCDNQEFICPVITNDNTSDNNGNNTGNTNNTGSNSSGNSSVNSSQDQTPPGLPNHINIGQNNDGMIISWNNPTDSDFSYIKIYRSLTKKTLGSVLANNITTNFFVDNTVELGQKYYYTIRAVDIYGNETLNIYIGNGIDYTASGNSHNNPTNSGSDDTEYRQNQIKNIISDALYILQKNFSAILEFISQKLDVSFENKVHTDYAKKLSLNNLSVDNQDKIIKFVSYGTRESLTLGAGERAGIVNSFQAAFGHLPESQTDWEDVLKIGSGRWPSQISTVAETRAKAAFKAIYLREANMNNPHDNAAITIMSYGLRPDKRNLDSERVAYNTFKYIYGYAPTSAFDWDRVRAIAYSGAVR